jgi:hydrogenase expression/formation protein HypC
MTGSPGDGPVCITCADAAVQVTVVELIDPDLARVDTGMGTETVSVALVDAAPGDVVLVHAGEAIASLGPAAVEPADAEPAAVADTAPVGGAPGPP